MAKSVDLMGYANDADLLHFDRERMQPVVKAAWDAMKAEAIKQNPDDPDAATKLLCGGCLSTFLQSFIEKVVEESAATPKEEAMFYTRQAEWADHMAIVSTIPRNDPITRLLVQLMARV